MGKCLVTKLNGSISNSEILRIGEIRVGISKVASPSNFTQGFFMGFNKEAKLEIIGDGYFTDENLSSNKGKTLTINPNVNTKIYVSNGDFELAILDKYSLTFFMDYDYYSYGNSTYKLYNKKISDIAVFKYSKGLTYIALSNTQVSGNVGELKTLTNLTEIHLANTQLSGNVGELKTLTALHYLSLVSTQVNGNVDELKTLTNLTELYLSNTQVSGNVGELKTLTNLTVMNLSNTQVSGNVGELKTLTNLTVFALSNNTIPLTGDIGNLNSLTKLPELSLKYSKLTGDLAALPASCRFISLLYDAGSTLTWGTRPSSAKVLAIEGNAKLANIDKMLQDQAQCQKGISSNDSSWYRIISVTGTRTSASDDAIVTLQEKGYTVSISSPQQ